MLERTIAVVSPHSCLSCGREGKLICNLCYPDICYTVPSRCYLCKAATENFAVCDKCKPKTALRHVWVTTEFKDLAKVLVHRFKFERAQVGASIIAGYLKDKLPFINDMLVVPVPTANSRVRLRGYDHATLLAKELAQLTRLPYSSTLARMGQTRQVGAKRQERTKQLEGAFRIIDEIATRNAKILLVDDVTTTGATLNEAARTLKRAGARQVNAVVFAQTR